MSSTDQAFVKAFSRRKLSEPGRPSGLPLPQHEPAQASNQVDPKRQLGSLELGSLELDRSVAGTAEVWVDSDVKQFARADQPRLDVPRPHVDRPGAIDASGTNNQAVTFERIDGGTPGGISTRTRATTPESGQDALSAVEGENQRRPAAPADPLQHIHTAYSDVHTAYAGMFADPSLIAASTSVENTGSESQQEWSAPAKETTHRASSEAMDRVEDDPVVEMRIDTPVSRDPVATFVPFQAVWEVDVFDVPTPVADLFFEGALFQQIAERMSDAVSSGLRTVLVTSAKPGEGRSSVAIGMAMAAAAAGIRVALVDADTESPSLADELRLELQYGWVDVIRRGLPIKEIAVQAVEDGVTLVPLMPPGVRPAATAFEMVQLIDLLTSNFELIILDGPTSLSSGLQQCAAKMDSAVIVRDVTRTDELAVCELSNRLQRAGVRGVGVVENFV